MSDTPDTRKLFDIAGAVDCLKNIGCDAATPNFVRSLIGRGSVGHVKIGKKFYVHRTALDFWLTKSERRTK